MTRNITSLFGKSSNITKEDVETYILNRIPESSVFECKANFERGAVDKKEIIKKQTIRALVGFLNSYDGCGVLALGIDAKKGTPEKIKPITKDCLDSEEQLRAIITGNIGSIPKAIQTPEISIIKIPMSGEDAVFFVEIEKKEDCVYYSKIDQNVYVRRNDETKELPFIESISFVSNKISAKVFLHFDNAKNTQEDRIEFKLGYRNQGLEPGREVTSIVRISSENKTLNFKLEGQVIKDISSMNSNAGRFYQVTAGSPPNTILLYPGVPSVVGMLTIFPKEEFELYIAIQNFESKGQSDQKISISKKDGTISVRENESKYSPWINIGN